MKRSLLVVCAITSIILFASCSKKAPELWIPVDCHQSCEEFYKMEEELSPVKCGDFDGKDKNLCELLAANGYLGGGWLKIFGQTLLEKNDFKDSEREESLKGRPVYILTEAIHPGLLYDGLTKEKLEREIYDFFETFDNGLGLFAKYDDVNNSDIKKYQDFIVKYIEIAPQFDKLFMRLLETEQQNLSDREKRDIFENEFGINYKNADKELKRIIDDFPQNSSIELLNRSADLLNYDDRELFDFFSGFYVYITLKSKFSKSKSTRLNEQIDFLKDIEKFSNAYFKRYLRYKNISISYTRDENHISDLKKGFLGPVIAFAISENKLPSSNEEIMRTLYHAMPYDDFSSIVHALEDYSSNNLFQGFSFKESRFLYTFICTEAQIDKDFFKERNAIKVSNHLISPFSCQYIDIKHKNGLITATSPGDDNIIGTKDDIIIFEYEDEKIMSYAKEVRDYTDLKKK